MPTLHVGKWGWIGLVIIIGLFVSIVLLAPPEKTLGETIRLVYLHVAFTRSGLYLLYFCGLLGLGIALTGRAEWQTVAQTIAWVAFALFLIGGLFSIFAQRASWGGLLLAEPRNRTSLSIAALAVIVLIINNWLPWIRLRGFLYTLLAVYCAWIIPTTPLILHPSNAGGSSPSLLIRYTFPALTILALLLGMWAVWHIEKSKRNERTDSGTYI
jgi:hypothetical protein